MRRSFFVLRESAAGCPQPAVPARTEVRHTLKINFLKKSEKYFLLQKYH